MAVWTVDGAEVAEVATVAKVATVAEGYRSASNGELWPPMLRKSAKKGAPA